MQRDSSLNTKKRIEGLRHRGIQHALVRQRLPGLESFNAAKQGLGILRRCGCNCFVCMYLSHFISKAMALAWAHLYNHLNTSLLQSVGEK